MLFMGRARPPWRPLVCERVPKVASKVQLTAAALHGGPRLPGADVSKLACYADAMLVTSASVEERSRQG